MSAKTVKREAEINRRTGETDIQLYICLDGSGKYEIDTGVRFLDHMLELFSKHGGFDLKVKCKGDTDVDFHHTVEDVAICLGAAFRTAAGDCRGIKRYGDIILPMDDALILCAVDFGGRNYLGFDVDPGAEKVGDFDTELVEEFMYALSSRAMMNIHLRKLSGKNTHHIIEGCFKALSRAMSEALSIDAERASELPTTKGVF